MSKTVLVSGGAKGIGRAAVRAFAREGYRAAVHCRTSLREAEALVAELRESGCDAEFFCADLRKECEAERLVREVEARFGKIDVLVNNAGISRIKLFSDCSERDYDEIMDSNLRSAFLLTRAVVPGMISRKSGKIVNVSSVWGLSGASCEALYSASKAALIGLTQALGKELAPSGINVNCVAPGVIDTDMNRELGAETLAGLAEETPAGRLGTPEEVASCILFLASEGASFLVGQTISPNGGIL